MADRSASSIVGAIQEQVRRKRPRAALEELRALSYHNRDAALLLVPSAAAALTMLKASDGECEDNKAIRAVYELVYASWMAQEGVAGGCLEGGSAGGGGYYSEGEGSSSSSGGGRERSASVGVGAGMNVAVDPATLTAFAACVDAMLRVDAHDGGGSVARRTAALQLLAVLVGSQPAAATSRFGDLLAAALRDASSALSLEYLSGGAAAKLASRARKTHALHLFSSHSHYATLALWARASPAAATAFIDADVIAVRVTGGGGHTRT